MKMEAEKRLLATRYFLNQMIDVLKDRNAFVYNLLAFLGISRSVTFVLQKELNNNPNFHDWYKKKQEEMRKDTLLSFFKDMRNVSIKEETPKIKTRKAITFTADAVLVDKLSIKLIKLNGTEEKIGSPPSTAFAYANPESKEPVVVNYYFLNGPEDDIISICEKYLEKLEEIVKEAYSISACTNTAI